MNCIEQCDTCPLNKLRPIRRPAVAAAVGDMIFAANMMGIPASFIVDFSQERAAVVTIAVKMGERGLNLEELEVGVEALTTICSDQCEFVEIKGE